MNYGIGHLAESGRPGAVLCSMGHGKGTGRQEQAVTGKGEKSTFLFCTIGKFVSYRAKKEGYTYSCAREKLPVGNRVRCEVCAKRTLFCNLFFSRYPISVKGRSQLSRIAGFVEKCGGSRRLRPFPVMADGAASIMGGFHETAGHTGGYK